MFAFFYVPSNDPVAGNCLRVVAFPVDVAPNPVSGGAIFPGSGIVYSEVGPYPSGLGVAQAATGLSICPSSTPAMLPHLIGAEVRRDLLKPQLHIAPGVAITGKRAFLEINRTDERDIVLPNPLGGADVTVHVVPTYTIDWGDRTGTDNTASHGGPWPDGDITHVYQDAVPVDVRVTVDWKVTWQGGLLPGTFRTNNQLHLPIAQVQAVIVPSG
jgi:hypothetical protein